jgi:hypothetical protein
MPTDLKTDPGLLERLAMAASRSITRSELHEQRISFIIGNLPKDSTITRDQIVSVLNRVEGELVAG